MDSRAKQRITGAVILVAMFVMLVPALLTGPANERGKDNETPAAPDEAGLRSYTIDIDAPAKPAQTTQAPLAAVELPTPSAATPMAVPGEAAAPEPTPVDSATTAPDVVAPMAIAPVPTPVSPPAHTSTAPASAPRGDSQPVVKPIPGGAFAVQLGSFSDRDNASRLVREMTAKGFAAFVAPITSNGRELYRVRVGPARDRAAAEALATQLRRIGQTGSIVSIS
ncbi:MAG: SPOR domain-containing protein [Steroidobacteraceae bacterium]|nr:SPOR domain-containing protein [Steroidobacteraceae bacterium]